MDSGKQQLTVSEQVKRVLQSTDPQDPPPRPTRGKATNTVKPKNTRQTTEKPTDKSSERPKEKGKILTRTMRGQQSSPGRRLATWRRRPSLRRGRKLPES